MNILRLVVASILAATAPFALAEVSQASPTGFLISFAEDLGVPVETAWKAVTQLPRWWSSRHTYSGQASNLTFESRAGGCWCERWMDAGAAASVQHGTVLLVLPNRALRVAGAFGPLQELAVDAVLTITLAPRQGKPQLRMTYRASGNADAGLDKLAPVVDRVIGEQFARLRRLAETGSAD